ncbi:MAG: hypothetical protein P1V81_17725, partial [Planctomycetota bacterium]|nr:hypothetical protein [Planctomycetota bacterium]
SPAPQAPKDVLPPGPASLAPTAKDPLVAPAVGDRRPADPLWPADPAPRAHGASAPAVPGELPKDPLLEHATVDAIIGIASAAPAAQAPNQGDPSSHQAPRLAVLTEVDESVVLAQETLDRGLAWLISAQAIDGGWHDVQAELAGVPTIVPYFDDVGATALAVQALARHCKLWPAEPAEVKGRDRALVRGLDHLVQLQDERGAIGPLDSFVYLVGHALGTEALALGIAHLAVGEPVGRPVTGRYREALRQAVGFIEAARNPYGAWRYDYPPVGDNDSVQTGRMLLALVEAFAVEVHAAPETFASGYMWFEEMLDRSSGRINYMDGHQYALRILGRQSEFPADKAELATAMDMILQVSRESVDIDRMTGGAKLLLAKRPTWSRATGTTDFTYWMYGTRAMGVVGGLLAERWNEGVLEALLPHQLRTGDDAGAWPGADAWSAPGLKTYPTAVNCMTLMDVVAAD